MEQNKLSLLVNLVLGAIALILFGAIFWAANYFLNSPKFSPKPTPTATPALSENEEIKGSEKELVEISFEDAAGGEKKEINGIRVNQEISIGDLPEGIEIGPLKSDKNIMDTGFYIRKDGEAVINSEDGRYVGYTVFGLKNIVYIVVAAANTGNGGWSDSQHIFVYNKITKELKPFDGDETIDGGTFTGNNPSVVNYGGYLYVNSVSEGHTSHDPADLFRGFNLFVLDDKGDEIDDKSLGLRKGDWNADASLVERAGKLYIKVKNNYYYSINGKNKLTDEDIPLYAGAADEYYFLNGNGKLVASSGEFKDQYQKNALVYEENIKSEKWGKGLQYANREYAIRNDWLSPLLARTMNYVLADEEDRAWEDFSADFLRLNSKYPLESKIESGKIREELSKILDGAKGIDWATGWKIYRNEKYGFQFEYPPQFTKGANCIIREADDGAEGALIYIGNHTILNVDDAGNLDLNAYVNEELKNTYSDTDNITTGPAYVGNEKGIKVNYRARGIGRYGETTYILKDGKIYSFSYIAGGDCAGDSNISELSVLGNIMSSFSFISPDPDSGNSIGEDATNSSVMLINIIIPRGMPKVYGQELGVSFDKIEGSMNIMKVYDQLPYGNGSIKLTGDKMKRYTDIGKRIACEFCCSAKTLVFDDGKAACACAHSQAMRGLAAYLVDKHGNEYTDDEILRELARWKVAYFPKAMVEKIVKEVNSGEYSSDIAALLKDVDKDKLKESIQGFQMDKQALPSQQGGC